jgi:hypothetical protein
VPGPSFARDVHQSIKCLSKFRRACGSSIKACTNRHATLLEGMRGWPRPQFTNPLEEQSSKATVLLAILFSTASDKGKLRASQTWCASQASKDPFITQLLLWMGCQTANKVFSHNDTYPITCLINCDMRSYLLQHRAKDVLKIPLRTRMSAPNFCPRARAWATAAISMASARLLHSLATCNCENNRFRRTDDQVKALYIAKKYHVEQIEKHEPPSEDKDGEDG